MIVTAKLFPKLQNVKNLLRPLSRKRRLGTRFDSQHVNAYQVLAKTPWSAFFMFLHHSQGSLFRKCLPQC